MGDLVVVMQQGGRIAQAGAPAELLAQPGLGLRGPLRGRRPRPQAPVALPRRRRAAGRGAHWRASASRATEVRVRARRRGPSATSSSSTPRERPIGWLDVRRPAAGRPRRRRAMPTPTSPAPRPAHHAQGRPRRCCSTQDVRSGIVVDRQRRRHGPADRRGGHGLPARRPLARGARGHRRGRGRGAGPSGGAHEHEPATPQRHDRDPLGLDRRAPRRRRREDLAAPPAARHPACWPASSSRSRWRVLAAAPAGHRRPGHRRHGAPLRDPQPGRLRGPAAPSSACRC